MPSQRPPLGDSPRPRAEACDRLPVAALRCQLELGTTTTVLADGTTLRLRWIPASGCWAVGGGRGQAQALLADCPRCQRRIRVLWRPPGQPWGCRCCHRLIYPSQRRCGAPAGRPKPRSTRLVRIAAAQRRAARLLGVEWPPGPLLWSEWDIPRRPDAPRLSWGREFALRQRLGALEWLRLGLLLPGIQPLAAAAGMELDQPDLERPVARAERVVRATAWAVRRPARDPRTAPSQRFFNGIQGGAMALKNSGRHTAA